ncbi:DUF397 domain-containing protein [Nocardia sp. CA-120079]|uniref:DUF397 domain-containing protein n=1 Tax=Nocardia sp. CA-120079 TaxID=3239974 RepID=UPI003D962349
MANILPGTIGPAISDVHYFRGTPQDSKNPTGPALTFAPGEWDAFTAGVTDGEFNRPA